jgi:fructose-1-phosphate kinase PfkB-like protein
LSRIAPRGSARELVHRLIDLLTGTFDQAVTGRDFYRRLAHDLRSGGTLVVTDLVGEQLDGALEGGVMLAKISARDVERPPLETAAAPHAAGAENVIVTCGE